MKTVAALLDIEPENTFKKKKIKKLFPGFYTYDKKQLSIILDDFNQLYPENIRRDFLMPIDLNLAEKFQIGEIIMFKPPYNTNVNIKDRNFPLQDQLNNNDTEENYHQWLEYFFKQEVNIGITTKSYIITNSNEVHIYLTAILLNDN